MKTYSRKGPLGFTRLSEGFKAQKRQDSLSSWFPFLRMFFSTSYSSPGQLSLISLDVIYTSFFFSFSLAIQQAYKILVPQPAIEPVPPAVECRDLATRPPGKSQGWGVKAALEGLFHNPPRLGELHVCFFGSELCSIMDCFHYGIDYLSIN